jgi:hypothetical protein
MRFRPSWAAPFARALADRLDRLQQNLTALAGRLRDAVVLAVGEAVAGAVRDTLRISFHDQQTRPALPSRPVWSQERSRSLYDRDEPPWRYDPADDLPEDEYDPEGQDFLPGPMPSAPTAKPQRAAWAPALALAGEAASWWSRRLVGRFPVLATLGVDLASAVAAYAGGPLTAGLALTRSVWSLMGLANAVELCASALAAICPERGSFDR